MVMDKKFEQNGDRRFKAIFENAAVGIFLIDSKGCFFEANRAFCNMIGFNENQLKEMCCDDISHPDDKEIHIKLFKDLAVGNIDKYHLEKRFINSIGKIIWVRITFSAIREQKTQNFLYSIAVVENITPQKEIEKQFEIILSNAISKWNIDEKERKENRETLKTITSSLSKGF